MMIGHADTTQPEKDRWQEILTIWRANQWLYGLVGFLLGILALPLITRVITNPLDLLGDLVPEAVGIVFTLGIIDRMYQRREQQREIHDLKARLLRDARSDVNDVAVQATHEIREHGWLEDEGGLLKGTNLAEEDES